MKFLHGLRNGRTIHVWHSSFTVLKGQGLEVTDPGAPGLLQQNITGAIQRKDFNNLHSNFHGSLTEF